MKRKERINRRTLAKAIRDAHTYGVADLTLTEAQLCWIDCAQKREDGVPLCVHDIELNKPCAQCEADCDA
jgi:hypothetical protein